MTKMDSKFAHDPKRWGGIGYVLTGLVVIVGAFGGLMLWSTTAELEGAVVAQGELRVESKAKPVQHREGGVVGAIFVKEGDLVKAGDPLVRLDPTTQEASFEIVDAQLIEALARKARLLAERDEAGDVSFPREVLERAASNFEVEAIARDQRNLFIARLEGFRKQNQQLGERIGQLRNEIDAVNSRRTGFETQLISVREELVVQNRLLERGLTTRTRLQEFRREQARIDGEIGALDAEEARLRRQIQETEIEITRLNESRREEAIENLREVEAQVVELQQRMIVAQDALQKIELRAPQDGIVQDMAVYAPGAVVQSGEQILSIVPISDRLVLEARIPPNERDRVRVGGDADVQFTAFNQRTTPKLTGEVTKISADRKIDEATAASYFSVEILVPEAERARLDKDSELVPGIQAQIFITTESRTPLNYLLKPLTDNFGKAFKER